MLKLKGEKKYDEKYLANKETGKQLR